MNKLSISIDLLKLQGAQRMTSKSGKDILVIDLAASRAKPHANGAVYLSMDAVEKKDADERSSHFVVEPITKQEREDGVKLPILGNGKTWDNSPKPQQSRPQQKRDNTEPTSWKDDKETDDIPF